MAPLEIMMKSPTVLALSNRNAYIFLLCLFLQGSGVGIQNALLINPLICGPFLKATRILGKQSWCRCNKKRCRCNEN